MRPHAPLRHIRARRSVRGGRDVYVYVYVYTPGAKFAAGVTPGCVEVYQSVGIDQSAAALEVFALHPLTPPYARGVRLTSPYARGAMRARAPLEVFLCVCVCYVCAS